MLKSTSRYFASAAAIKKRQKSNQRPMTRRNCFGEGRVGLENKRITWERGRGACVQTKLARTGKRHLIGGIMNGPSPGMRLFYFFFGGGEGTEERFISRASHYESFAGAGETPISRRPESSREFPHFLFEKKCPTTLTPRTFRPPSRRTGPAPSTSGQRYTERSSSSPATLLLSEKKNYCAKIVCRVIPFPTLGHSAHPPGPDPA